MPPLIATQPLTTSSPSAQNNDNDNKEDKSDRLFTSSYASKSERLKHVAAAMKRSFLSMLYTLNSKKQNRMRKDIYSQTLSSSSSKRIKSSLLILLPPKVLKSKRLLAIIAIIVLSIMQMINIAPQLPLENVIRLLSLNCSTETTPYIPLTTLSSKTTTAATTISTRSPPLIPRRRTPPSHISLCQEFIKRKQDLIDNPAQKINTKYSLTEDPAVCLDWNAPHASLLEILASTIVGYIGTKYQMTYRHNCRKSGYDGGGADLDWTTIQQKFPQSSLVLDNGSVDEDEIAKLCTNCIAEFTRTLNSNKNNGKEDDTPAWFDPNETHHCLLYPKSSRPVINEKGNKDTAAMAQQKSKAQSLPISKVLRTLQDRIRLAAIEQNVDTIDYKERVQVQQDQQLGENISLQNGETESNAYLTQDVLSSQQQRVQQKSSSLSLSHMLHDKSVVIYIEESSMPMTNIQYNKYIPPTTDESSSSIIKSIDILLHPTCARSDECYAHGVDIKEYLQRVHPSIKVELLGVLSSSEAYSRMVLSKYLICPPGTTGCLLPAVSKEDGTFAVVGESPDRPTTFRYFDFVSGFESQLQVATVNVRATTRMGGGRNDGRDDTSLLDVGTIGEGRFGDEGQEGKNDKGGLFSGAGYRDGCVELRGRLGSWEQDFDYAALGGKHAKVLRGSAVLGDPNPDRYSPGSGKLHHGRRPPNNAFDEMHNAPGAPDTDGDREDWSPNFWTEEDPECQLDLLNLAGLCEVVSLMKLTVVQFIGDQYTEDMVRSFWKLLDLPDADNPGKQPLKPGQRIPVYRKTVNCDKERITFDIVFTPNETLVTSNDDENNDEMGFSMGDIPLPDQQVYGQYVPVPAPRSNVGQPLPFVNGGGYWWNDPYGSVNGFSRNGGVSYGQAYVGGADVPGQGLPMNQQCQCVPFMSQYQSNIATTRTSAQQQPRQFIIAGASPNQSYEEWCRQFDQFGQTVTSKVNPNDIVVMRSAVVPLGSCNCQNCNNGRKMQEQELKDGKGREYMSMQEVEMANAYMTRSIDEYRRRTKQMDLLNYDPELSQMPRIHFLDVSKMAHTHPHAQKSLSEAHGGRKLCQQSGFDSSIYDSWNHMLYTNMKDMALAEKLAPTDPQVQAMRQAAPLGSPYSYAAPPPLMNFNTP